MAEYSEQSPPSSPLKHGHPAAAVAQLSKEGVPGQG